MMMDFYATRARLELQLAAILQLIALMAEGHNKHFVSHVGRVRLVHVRAFCRWMSAACHSALRCVLAAVRLPMVQKLWPNLIARVDVSVAASEVNKSHVIRVQY